MFLNDGSYVQIILGGTATVNQINTEGTPTIFEVLVWFNCVNVVFNEDEKKTLSLKLKYRSGNIISLVVHIFCSAWTKLLACIGPQSLSAQFLHCLWYSEK